MDGVDRSGRYRLAKGFSTRSDCRASANQPLIHLRITSTFGEPFISPIRFLQPLFVTQRIDRIKAGCLYGRQHAETDTDNRTKQQTNNGPLDWNGTFK